MKKITKKMSEIENDEDCPLPVSVIPNYMGINLCSVDSVSWEEQDDGQLVSLTIQFIPAPTEVEAARRRRKANEKLWPARSRR